MQGEENIVLELCCIRMVVFWRLVHPSACIPVFSLLLAAGTILHSCAEANATLHQLCDKAQGCFSYWGNIGQLLQKNKQLSGQFAVWKVRWMLRCRPMPTPSLDLLTTGAQMLRQRSVWESSASLPQPAGSKRHLVTSACAHAAKMNSAPKSCSDEGCSLKPDTVKL